MVKISRISRLEVVSKKNSYACAPPAIELIYIVEKHNTLITINFWPAVRRNIMRARSVWGRLGTLLRREGVDPKVSASFYRAVVQAILSYGSGTWVLSTSMAKRIEGTHTEFRRMIMGKRTKQLGDGTWDTPGAEVIQEAAGTQSARIYIERRQVTVAQWVALCPLFDACARETGYEGGGRRRKVWWRQEATEKQLWASLEDLRVAKRRRRSGS